MEKYREYGARRMENGEWSERAGLFLSEDFPFEAKNHRRKGGTVATL
jgi:hypothetical protein